MAEPQGAMVDALFSPVPEGPEVLVAQQKQLVDGDRNVQMFPKGHTELPLLEGFARMLTPKGDVFHYRAEAISPKQILHASATGTENELLDLGPVTKHETLIRTLRGERPVAVVERNKQGTEVRGAAGTDKTALAQLTHLLKHKSRGHTVHVEKPVNLVKSRGK